MVKTNKDIKLKHSIASNLGNELIRFIEKHNDKPWDWECLSLNPNITMDCILSNSDKPWDWDNLSRNPNITMDIVDNTLINLGIGMQYPGIKI